MTQVHVRVWPASMEVHVWFWEVRSPASVQLDSLDNFVKQLSVRTLCVYKFSGQLYQICIIHVSRATDQSKFSYFLQVFECSFSYFFEFKESNEIYQFFLSNSLICFETIKFLYLKVLCILIWSKFS